MSTINLIDRKELEEVEKKNFEKNLPRTEILYRRTGDLRKAFQVLFSDIKIKLQEPYGLRIINEPIHILASIYRQIIVPIRPVSKRAFKDIYGVTIDEFISLYKAHRVIPILSKPYEHYTLDYDPLFKEAHIPTASRVTLFFQHLKKKIDLMDIQEFRKKSGYFDFNGALLKRYENHPNPKERVFDVIEEHLRDLKTFGYEHLCMSIMEINDPDAAFWTAAWACNLLTDPFTRGLGGFCNYDAEHLYTEAKQIDPKSEVLRYILYRFSKGIEIHVPDSHNVLKYWDKVEKIQDREAALNALKAIPKNIEKGEIVKAEKLLSETMEQVAEISKKATHISNCLKFKPYFDFGFSVITPALVSLIQPFLGTLLFLGIEATKRFKKRKYNKMVEQIAMLLNNPFLKSARKINITPALLWNRIRVNKI